MNGLPQNFSYTLSAIFYLFLSRFPVVNGFRCASRLSNFNYVQDRLRSTKDELSVGKAARFLLT